jgi:hypothetical protein
MVFNYIEINKLSFITQIRGQTTHMFSPVQLDAEDLF